MQIAKYIEKNHEMSSIDLIHAHTLFPAGVAAMYLARKNHIPFIVTSHGMDFYRCFPKDHNLSRGKPYNTKELNLVKQVMQTADQVICVSEIFGQDVKKIFPNSKIKIIENSYDVSLFKPGIKQIAREKLHIAEDTKMILSVGNFVPAKGHIYLLEAMNSLKASNSQFKLFLIGKGPEKERYKSYINYSELSGSVEIVKQVSQVELVNYYQASDVFVLPSLSESFGVALVEAMACGLPAIATKTQGPKQIIEDQKTGILVEISNAEAIAENIEKLMSDNLLHKKLSNHAAQFVADTFSNKEQEIIDLYYKIINNYSS